MNGKDFAIGVLSVTATILLTGLILVSTLMPEPALGFAQGDRAGDYIVKTGQLDDTVELLLILDAPSQRLNAYWFNVEMGGIELLQSIDVRIDRARGK